jgi:hypothetical protein
MLRVLATIRESEYANTFKSEQGDLGKWVKEIHAAVYPHLVCKIIRYLHLVLMVFQDTTNVFTNYANQPASASGNFYDASSTAFLASTVYRASLMLNQHTFVPYAERSRRTLFNSTSAFPTSNATASFDGYQHLTSDGWLTPVVNPHSYGLEGNKSAEAQAFVVQLHAAHRDWVLNGSKGENSAKSLVVSAHAMAVAALVGSLVCLGW